MKRLFARRLLCASLAVSTCSGVSLFAQEGGGPTPAAPQAVLADEPQTPEEKFDAVLLMLRLDRFDLAKVYLDQFLATNPDDAMLLNLRNQHGAATFLRLSRIEALQPESQQLLKTMEAAAVANLNDPAFFDSLLTQLEGPPRERQAAVTAIRQIGADAVPGLLQRLGEGDRIEQHDLLLYTLTNMGQKAIPPLLGAIEAPVERTRVLAIEALGFLGSEEIVPALLYPAFGSDQPPLVQRSARQAIARIRYHDSNRTDQVTFNGVVDEVRDRAVQHFAGDYEWIPDANGQVIVWSWDPAANQLIKTATSPARASSFLAQRLAREAMLMAPDREDLRALFLATSLAEAGYRAGWDQPWPVGPGTAHNLALYSGTDLTNAALQTAIDHRNTAAAVGALKALGQMATENDLAEGSNGESAIVAALTFPHDRVQFAAASCILQIDPAGPFPAAYRVVDILTRSLSDGGRPASVVIDPNSQRGASVAAMLNELGYDASVALTGREGFKTAASRGDITLAVVHPNAVRWELTQTVANFRADARTANIPVAIYGPQPFEYELRRLVDRTSQSKFIVTGGDSADWQRQLVSLVNAVDVPPLTPEQREQRIATAAYWLRHIADGRRTETFDLAPAEDALSAAIEDPLIAADAAFALSAIPRASVQQRLAEVVTAPGQPIEIRELAAWQLARHIREFGRLVTEAGVQQLQSVWQTADDPRIHTALTTVLGTLGITQSGVGAALQGHELSPVP